MSTLFSRSSENDILFTYSEECLFALRQWRMYGSLQQTIKGHKMSKQIDHRHFARFEKHLKVPRRMAKKINRSILLISSLRLTTWMSFLFFNFYFVVNKSEIKKLFFLFNLAGKFSIKKKQRNYGFQKHLKICLPFRTITSRAGFYKIAFLMVRNEMKELKIVLN